MAGSNATTSLPLEDLNDADMAESTSESPLRNSNKAETRTRTSTANSSKSGKETKFAGSSENVESPSSGSGSNINVTEKPAVVGKAAETLAPAASPGGSDQNTISKIMSECRRSHTRGMTEIEIYGEIRLKIMERYAHQPQACFGIACGVHCFLVFLFMIGMAAGGGKFMAQTSEVALHIWDNEWKIKGDTILQGAHDCDFDGIGSAYQPTQTVYEIAEGERNYKLSILFEATSGNMMTPDNLKKVKELEDYILTKSGYTDHCLKVNGSGPSYSTTGCAYHSSPILACEPMHCGYYQLTQGTTTPQLGCGAMNSYGRTPATPSQCDATKSYPAGVYQCTSSNGRCSRNDMVLDQDHLTAKLKQYAAATYAVDYPETDFLEAADSAFGSGATIAVAVKSEFKFGFPLPGYTTTADRKKDQVKDIEKFMKDAYFKYLEEWNSKQGDDPPVKMGYAGGVLASDSINSLLYMDFALVFMAFFVVLLYTVAMSQSWFLSLLALAQIFVCFLTGFMVYRILYGAFFGSFHIMALFLLLGVGIDDVFVMLDHFTAAALVGPEYHEDLWNRISWTWKHAVIAMGVTSSTTVIAFVMNATSSFPGIQAFGIFSGCLVACLYISMCFYYVAVVCYNYHRFRNTPFCFGINDKVADMGATMTSAITTKTERKLSDESEEDAEEKPVVTKPIEVEQQKGQLVSFFENHFSKFILGHRIKILLVFLALTIFMLVQVTNLTAEKTAPKFLPDDHPVEYFTQITKKRFVRGGNIFNTKVKFVFGFDKDTIDRDGTDSTGEAFGEDDPKDQYGKVRWNPTWNTNTGTSWLNFLRGLDCAVQICNEAEKVDGSRNTGGPPAYTMEGCWPRDIKLELQRANAANWETQWNAILNGDNATFFAAVGSKSASTPGWYETIGKYVFSENAGTVRWYFFELTLTSSLDMEYEKGNELAKSWKDWMAAQHNTPNCSAVSDTFWGFVTSDDFHQFKIVETLISEMKVSVATSIIVAFVVLCLATGNIFVGSLAGVSIGMIVIWVMAMIPVLGWELGITENLTLVMVPGLSVDYVAHLAEAFNQAKYDDREHRVIHCLEHSGVSIVSGAISTMLAALCLLACKIVFFVKFGTLLMFTIIFSVMFSLFFFPSLMALVGPTGSQGDWHHLIAPCLHHENNAEKRFSAINPTKRQSTANLEKVQSRRQSKGPGGAQILVDKE